MEKVIHLNRVPTVLLKVRQVARYVVLRFSRVGVVSVAVLIVSGLLNTLMTVDEPLAVLGSAYGRILLLKVLLFMLMLSVAAFNRKRLTPQLVNSTDSLPAFRSLVRNCFVEVALGGLILALVGVIGILPPGGEG
jgi:putative copper resistance protein D